jgi:hypothetical protein
MVKGVLNLAVISLFQYTTFRISQQGYDTCSTLHAIRGLCMQRCILFTLRFAAGLVAMLGTLLSSSAPRTDQEPEFLNF